ncbi:hypothetical protein HARRISON_34 [Paenibacillus phage Harrison]|uniref:Uncharacterized protein n=2 Tax=Harrisonvirus harrison TaxID=1982221 RepID=A0A0K2CZ73_9CAUD|nr:hypothetical protein HARRISON_34 [Paenibacillus phage Harrison]ALA12485.1 hypothetical protein HARRISON_34 [Paenibacillus phage Harrison]ALA12646.1 hypothetical protein PAISLEY_34 [Paenibacillus phage Paisley]
MKPSKTIIAALFISILALAISLTTLVITFR